MKKIVFGLAAVLLGTAAYAQTSTSVGVSAGVSGSTGSSSTILRQRSQIGTGAQVGVESRERTGVSVRRSTVHEVSEPSVEVRRRRSVTSIEEPATEVHRTVVKHRMPAKKKLVIRKKPARYVMRTRHVVEEPSVAIRRSRTVRRYEVNEPSVVTHRRTTVRRDVSVGTGVSVERRAPSAGVSVSTQQRSSAPATTGTVSTRSQTSTTGSASTGGTNLRLKQQGGASGSTSVSQ